MSGGAPTATDASAPVDFLGCTIAVPPPRPGSVSRTALVNRLRAASAPVVTVVAPAGYGKTTALAQWARRDPRPFVWVTLGAEDDDPAVLVRHVAAALEAVDGLGATTLPRLAAALWAHAPLVLVLDGFGVLQSPAALDVVASLIEDAPGGSVVVAAGREEPLLPLARLRADGRLLELGTADLAMGRREARALLRAAGVEPDEAGLAELVEACEGWPAALHLAAVSARDAEASGRPRERFGGSDRYLADYLRTEYLAGADPAVWQFLRRTSVLERLSGPLCDAVLETAGSAGELERIERTSRYLVPLDGTRRWYRHHRLLRELLARELVESEPDLVPALHRRAADWLEADGDAESALEHAFASGDLDRAASIVATIALPVYYSGRVETLERWLDRFEEAGSLERYPAVALQGCRVHVLRGRSDRAERWLQAAKEARCTGTLPDGSTSLDAWIAVVRAWLCSAGVRQMLADAQTAADLLAAESEWRPSALAAQGAALVLLDEVEAADEVLAAAADAAAAHGSRETQVVALAERALLAEELGDHASADRWSSEAEGLVAAFALEGVPARALEHAVAARVLLRRGRWNDARARLGEARALTPRLTIAIPWLAAQVRLELARACLALRDRDGAASLLAEVDELLERAPGLGTPTAERASELRRDLELVPEGGSTDTAGLTPAELRLLPLLATHLSFREIAERLYVSRNTIKTQAISVYRKLGVSSRSEAVAEAQRLGLGEHLRVVVSDPR